MKTADTNKELLDQFCADFGVSKKTATEMVAWMQEVFGTQGKTA